MTYFMFLAIFLGLPIILLAWLNRRDGQVGRTQPQSLVAGLQNVSNLVLGPDGYLYFTYALGSRGMVGRVWPEDCQDGGCSNKQVEIVVSTEMEAPLAGLTILPDLSMYLHTIYRPEIYQVDLARS